jgi:hypothetical protein
LYQMAQTDLDDIKYRAMQALETRDRMGRLNLPITSPDYPLTENEMGIDAASLSWTRKLLGRKFTKGEMLTLREKFIGGGSFDAVMRAHYLKHRASNKTPVEMAMEPLPEEVESHFLRESIKIQTVPPSQWSAAMEAKGITGTVFRQITMFRRWASGMYHLAGKTFVRTTGGGADDEAYKLLFRSLMGALTAAVMLLATGLGMNEAKSFVTPIPEYVGGFVRGVAETGNIFKANQRGMDSIMPPARTVAGLINVAENAPERFWSEAYKTGSASLIEAMPLIGSIILWGVSAAPWDVAVETAAVFTKSYYQGSDPKSWVDAFLGNARMWIANRTPMSRALLGREGGALRARANAIVRENLPPGTDEKDRGAISTWGRLRSTVSTDEVYKIADLAAAGVPASDPRMVKLASEAVRQQVQKHGITEKEARAKVRDQLMDLRVDVQTTQRKITDEEWAKINQVLSTAQVEHVQEQRERLASVTSGLLPAAGRTGLSGGRGGGWTPSSQVSRGSRQTASEDGVGRLLSAQLRSVERGIALRKAKRKTRRSPAAGRRRIRKSDLLRW